CPGDRAGLSGAVQARRCAPPADAEPRAWARPSSAQAWLAHRAWAARRRGRGAHASSKGATGAETSAGADQDTTQDEEEAVSMAKRARSGPGPSERKTAQEGSSSDAE